jgi:hypothetical protein
MNEANLTLCLFRTLCMHKQTTLRIINCRDHMSLPEESQQGVNKGSIEHGTALHWPTAPSVPNWSIF